MIGNFQGDVEKPHSDVKIAAATFWATFGNIWTTFTPPSGHTECGHIGISTFCTGTMGNKMCVFYSEHSKMVMLFVLGTLAIARLALRSRQNCQSHNIEMPKMKSPLQKYSDFGNHISYLEFCIGVGIVQIIN